METCLPLALGIGLDACGYRLSVKQYPDALLVHCKSAARHGSAFADNTRRFIQADLRSDSEGSLADFVMLALCALSIYLMLSAGRRRNLETRLPAPCGIC